MRLLPALLTAAAVLVCTAAAKADDAKTVVLFDGSDLSKWTFHLQDPEAKLEDVWSIRDGVLICKGNPRGYLRTLDDFENYVLTLEWRWPADAAGGNSGVLVHTTTPGEIGVWPKSLEVQLHAGNAGDFWNIGTTIDVPNAEERTRGRRVLNLTEDSEKPFGEWNHMEITCRGSEVIVKVNGDLVNHGTNVSQSRGAISLQSEGAEVHFRNIKLTRLK